MEAQRAHPQVSCAGALRRALGQAARDVAGLQLSVAMPAQERRSLAELLEMMDATALGAIVEGPGDALGLVLVDAALMAALVEVQTTGAVAAQPDQPRRPTRVDAAMCAPVIDATLGGVEAALATGAASDAPPWIAGYRYASFLDTPASLALLLDDITYSVLSVQVTMAGGDRTGHLTLCLPARRPDSTAPDADVPPRWSVSMERAVMAAPVRLRALLHRRPLELGQLAALRPGMHLTLPRESLEAVALETAEGVSVATGRLGQSRGFRALRLGMLHAPGQRLSPVQDAAAAFLAATPPGRDGHAADAPGDPAPKVAQAAMPSAGVPRQTMTGVDAVAAGDDATPRVPDAMRADPAPDRAAWGDAQPPWSDPPLDDLPAEEPVADGIAPVAADTALGRPDTAASVDTVPSDAAFAGTAPSDTAAPSFTEPADPESASDETT